MQRETLPSAVSDGEQSLEGSRLSVARLTACVCLHLHTYERPCIHLHTSKRPYVMVEIQGDQICSKTITSHLYDKVFGTI